MNFNPAEYGFEKRYETYGRCKFMGWYHPEFNVSTDGYSIWFGKHSEDQHYGANYFPTPPAYIDYAVDVICKTVHDAIFKASRWLYDVSYTYHNPKYGSYAIDVKTKEAVYKHCGNLQDYQTMIAHINNAKSQLQRERDINTGKIKVPGVNC